MTATANSVATFAVREGFGLAVGVAVKINATSASSSFACKLCVRLPPIIEVCLSCKRFRPRA